MKPSPAWATKTRTTAIKAGLIGRRGGATRQPRTNVSSRLRTKRTPPMLGVPCFFWWPSGAYSLMF